MYVIHLVEIHYDRSLGGGNSNILSKGRVGSLAP